MACSLAPLGRFLHCTISGHPGMRREVQTARYCDPINPPMAVVVAMSGMVISAAPSCALNPQSSHEGFMRATAQMTALVPRPISAPRRAPRRNPANEEIRPSYRSRRLISSIGTIWDEPSDSLSVKLTLSTATSTPATWGGGRRMGWTRTRAPRRNESARCAVAGAAETLEATTARANHPVTRRAA